MIRAQRSADIIPISALTGEGVDALVSGITEALDGVRLEEDIELGFDEGRRRAWLFGQNIVEHEHQSETGWTFSVRWTQRQRESFNAL
jgi:GTP-binding protein HflX